MNARTRRLVEMIRDDNEPRDVARDMLTAVLQYVADLEEDDPGDNEPADAHRIARLRANVELALADV
jgi:hypothetical protein